ncbi:MAG: glycosyltransferase [Nanoarchaeota archaeon]
MKILIIKTEALGDVLRTTFIMQGLKEKYAKESPEIFWLTDKSALPFFLNNPYIKKTFTLEQKEYLKNYDFDIVINLEEDLENAELTTSLKPKKIIGFFAKDGKIFPTKTASEWHSMSGLGKKPFNDILKKKNIKTHRQIMSEIVDINPEKYEPFLRLTAHQRKIAENFMRRYMLSKEDLIIGINTGSADRWPKSLSIKKTALLIEKIYKKYKAKIILFGGKAETERNKEIIKITKASVIDAGCGNDLYEFPALISICSIIITSDTLGLHISLALKRKTIVLVGPTSSAELDMYSSGEKIIAKSNCICCYKKECESMEKIDINEIIKAIDKLSDEKITILITAFKEPTIRKSIEAALNQKTSYQYDIIISAPDKETIEIASEYAKKDKRLKIFKDPGKGKSHALNLIFKNFDSDILILTDGDVSINPESVEEIMKLFKEPEIGCLSGRPIALETKEKKYGYWANFLLEAVHRLRKKAFDRYNFLECSGYLFAFRKKKIKAIPLDVAEDTIIPYYFWQKGYRIGYAEKAKVYIKNASNWKDWLKQKTRASKAHETLEKYVDIKTTPRIKTFFNEAAGITLAFQYPSKLKELIWTIELIAARLYMWLKVHLETKITGKHYSDAWERVESAR